VTAALVQLQGHGFTRAITSALNPLEQTGFLEAGFSPHEHLHLLSHRLGAARSPPKARPHRSPSTSERPEQDTMLDHKIVLDQDTVLATAAPTIRRARRRDRRPVLHIDGEAFDSFWRFDQDGLRDALTATPISRFRFAETTRVVGYSVTGRSHDHGYLQRLAVDPREHGRGIGRALVLDSLHWLDRRGVTSVLVNTQEANRAALALYESVGFDLEPGGLDVLTVDLTSHPSGVPADRR
jgi:ribosomal protein S18 acetylase RimI-like enzyme